MFEQGDRFRLKVDESVAGMEKIVMEMDAKSGWKLNFHEFTRRLGLHFMNEMNIVMNDENPKSNESSKSRSIRRNPLKSTHFFKIRSIMGILSQRYYTVLSNK
uniref:EF-hand domain-containing protein n=1 Tax=Timspurckia oligopyrenoides TaxID=708627 RepID=A0A7S1ETN8_9RHOD|mmetsp:Transcript_6878/g.12313  ORF Transcript_6878/g.12313 Transcript_6878/m.12313 type:complete len:103 (+) Transcript_6878:1124-1432(+)